MRLLKVLVLVIMLGFVLGGTARANDLTVVLDPQNSLTSIVFTGAPIVATWQACTTANGFPSTIAGDDGCFAITNETGTTLHSLSVTLAAGSTFPSQAVTCNPLNGLTSDDCAGAMLNPDGTVTLTFFGGPGIFNFQTFFVAEIGDTNPNSDLTATVSVPTHDPSTLVLLLAGMAMLGTCGIRRFAA